MNEQDAALFKNWMESDRYNFQRAMPYYLNYYDRDFNFSKDRQFWLMMIIGCYVLVAGVQKYKDENLRWFRTYRLRFMQPD